MTATFVAAAAALAWALTAGARCGNDKAEAAAFREVTDAAARRQCTGTAASQASLPAAQLQLSNAGRARDQAQRDRARAVAL